MPSPFPGMDPFIEQQEWEDFHATAIGVIREMLVPRVHEEYVVRVERRIYVERHADEATDEKVLIADIAIARDHLHSAPEASAATATLIAPVEGVLPMPEEKRESFLTIRDRHTLEVVTIIELLSPGNKRPGSDGRTQYLSKRHAVLESRTHLVEIDLLRGGSRLPMMTPLPPGDYYAIVSRANRRPRAEVYGWPLSHPLPTLGVPLKTGTADVSLPLQEMLATVYDRARYDLSIDYRAELVPPLSEADRQWMRQFVN